MIPALMAQNINTVSTGSFTAVLKRTMDKAPTIPSDNAKLELIALGILYFISYTMSFKRGSKYLFVLKYNIDMDEQIEKVIKKLPKYKLKSKSITGDIIELTFEIELSEGKTELLNKFKGVNGIISASLISYQSDFGA